MIYSKTCEYALRALSVFVGRDKERISVQEVSQVAGVSASYVAKIFQCLSQRGMLNSHRGPSGGYSLTAPSSEITLIRVIRALDDLDNSPFSNCVMGLHDCSDKEPCPLHHTWVKAKDEMLKELSQHTIADISKIVDKFHSGKCDRVTLSKGMRAIFSP